MLNSWPTRLWPMWLFFYIFQVVTFPSYSEATEKLSPLEIQLHQLIEELEQEENSKGIVVGLGIYNVTKQKSIFSFQAQKSFIPASTFKLLVTTAMLHRLSPEYRYKTELYYTGKVSPQGVLMGDLIIKGYGDPSLTVDDLDGMIEQLKGKEGIKQIQGHILVDESYFDDVRLGRAWMWDDEPWYYSAQVNALAVHRNSVDVTLLPAEGGRSPRVQVHPPNDYVKMINEVIVVEGAKDETHWSRPRMQNTIHIQGTIGQLANPVKQSLSLEDPALFVAHVLKQQLQQKGVVLSPQIKMDKTVFMGILPAVTHYSKPLRELVVHLNKESDNFYAEMFLKTLGAVIKRDGSFAAGLEAVAEVLAEADIITGYRQVDGSGLSRLNAMTPEQMLKLLLYIQNQPYKTIIEQSLPTAGVDGTLEKRMLGTPAQNKLYAKSGSMSGVNNLAGYVKAANGDKIAVSLFLNGIYQSKYAGDFQDAVASLLAQYPHLLMPPSEQKEDGGGSPTPFSKTLDDLLQDQKMASTHIGMMVSSLDDDQVVYAHQVDKLLTPTSTVKVWPTMAALLQLGTDHRIKTELLASSKISPTGKWSGDLIIKGNGDPSFGRDGLEQLVKAIEEKGITSIEGDILVDDHYFDDQRYPLGWTWDHESDGRYAQTSALCSYQGKLAVHYSANKKVGLPIIVETQPETEYVEIINEAVTGGRSSEKTLRVERVRGTNQIHLTGTLPISAPAGFASISMEDPALFTGSMLKEMMKARRIGFSPTSKVKRGVVPAQAISLAVVSSPTLQELLYTMNSKDDHFYAEMLLKYLGAQIPRDDHVRVGSSLSGIELIQKLLKEQSIPALFDLYDGSGVTRYNQISARQLNDTLSAMSKYDSFYTSLPIITFEDAPQAKVRGITSSEPGLSSWAGYITNEKGETFAVSILMNGMVEDEVGQRMMEEILSKISRHET